jgi:hypothetical protein
MGPIAIAQLAPVAPIGFTAVAVRSAKEGISVARICPT